MPSDRVARALLRLYPRAWRERYGDEFLALVEETGVTWRVTMNVVAGAAKERLRRRNTVSAAETAHGFRSLRAVAYMLSLPVAVATAAWYAAGTLADAGFQGGDRGAWIVIVGGACQIRAISCLLQARNEEWKGIGVSEVSAWTIALFFAATSFAWPGPRQPAFWLVAARLFVPLPQLLLYTRGYLALARRQSRRRIYEGITRLNLHQ